MRRKLTYYLLTVMISAAAGIAVAGWPHWSRAREVPVSGPAYSSQIVHVLEQLRASISPMQIVDPDEKGRPHSFIGGSSVGNGGGPGTFYLLIPYFEKMARDDDVALMLKDINPVVRVMAAQLIIEGTNASAIHQPLASLYDDREVVEVVRVGCIIDTMTVAELVRQMNSTPDYFRERQYREGTKVEDRQ